RVTERQDRPLSASAVRRPARHDRPRVDPTADGCRHHRGGPAGLYAWPYPQRRLHHLGRGTEHLGRTDENVPHPAGLRLQGGGHRGHHSGGPARRGHLRAEDRPGDPHRYRRRRLLRTDQRRCGASPPGGRHHRRLRPVRDPPPAARHRWPQPLRPRRTPAMSTEVTNESGYRLDETEFAALARHVIDAMGVHPQAELEIRFVDTEVMTELHVQWMDEDGPTDVLSFPMDELRPGVDGELSEEGILGSIVVCPVVAADQARSAGHSAEEEMLLLTTHGIL